jgi:hypothetical protein
MADFNHDGVPESLALTGGHLTIFSNNQSVWQSPLDWTVVQAEITDLNQDGSAEATLLIWRVFRPWPVDQWLPHGGRIASFQDAEGNSCHIILIGWRGGEYREIWAGSALADPVRSFAAADLNGDKFQDLVTLEGSYSDSHQPGKTFEYSMPAHGIKIWEWNGFGFTIVSGMEGMFTELALVQTVAGLVLILVP